MPSCAIVLCGISLGFLVEEFIWASGSSGLGFLIRQLLLSVFFYGYPLCVGAAIERLRDRRNSRACMVALIGCLWAFVAQVLLLLLPPQSNPLVRLLVFVCILPGFVAPPYIVWFGANRLAAAELRRSVRLDHYLGALLLFAFLPIGSFFLQRRLNRLLPCLEAEE